MNEGAERRARAEVRVYRNWPASRGIEDGESTTGLLPSMDGMFSRMCEEERDGIEDGTVKVFLLDGSGAVLAESPSRGEEVEFCFGGEAIVSKRRYRIGSTPATDRTKAQFKAIRETVGLSEQDVEAALGESGGAVALWEDPECDRMPSDAAWRALEEAYDTMVWQASYAADWCREEEGSQGEPDGVVLTYYRDREMYERYGSGREGTFETANATARLAAASLRDLGYRVRFAYPCSGSVRMQGGSC